MSAPLCSSWSAWLVWLRSVKLTWPDFVAFDSDFDDADVQSRQKDVQEAFAMVRHLQVGQSESLQAILKRVSSECKSVKRKRKSPSAESALWPRAHKAFADRHGLSAEECTPTPKFVEEMSGHMPPRAVHAMWHLLAIRAKKVRSSGMRSC